MNRKMMRLALGALLVSAFSAAHADETSDVHFVLGGGLTVGGDNLGTVQYTNGNKYSLHAGGLINFGMGVLWQSSSIPLAISGTVNYHVDRANGSNGNVRFSRTPVELLGYYTGVQNWRFGGGIRHSNSPKFTYDVAGTKWSTEFKSSTGAVLEAGYQLGNSGWLNLRLVGERYQPESYTNGTTTTSVSNSPKVNGSHFGIGYTHQF